MIGRVIIYTPRAQQDLEEAFVWYEEREEGVGRRFLGAVTVFVSNLQLHPELYPSAGRRSRRAPMRQFPYTVYYEPRPDMILVHGVFHTSRDPSLWRRRLRQTAREDYGER